MVIVADAVVYGFPAAALLFLALPLIVWLYFGLERERTAAAEAFLGGRLSRWLALARSAPNQALRITLLALAWMAAALALMQPAWQRISAAPSSHHAVGGGTKAQGEELRRRPQDVIFLLDTSPSMSVVDTMTGQTRLERAKDIIADTVNRLTASNTGLDAFSLIVKVVVPPTLDHLYLRMLLRDVQINETGLAGTDFRRVLHDLKQSLWGTPTDKYITLVIVSDGGDTHLEGLPADRRASYLKEIVSELGSIDANQRRIFTVGVGSASGQTIPGLEYQGKPVLSALVPDVLQQIADKGHGAYFQANRFDGMGLSEELSSAIIEGSPPPLQPMQGQGGGHLAATEAPPAIPLFYLPLLLAIGLLVAALLLPEVDHDAVDPIVRRIHPSP